MHRKNTIPIKFGDSFQDLAFKKNHIEVVNIICSPEHEMDTKHKAQLEVSKQLVEQFGEVFNQ
tara:strand:- start:1220 stop:1408 length:189 start_codon:yes stop_codon:yes gene_type:complete